MLHPNTCQTCRTKQNIPPNKAGRIYKKPVHCDRLNSTELPGTMQQKPNQNIHHNKAVRIYKKPVYCDRHNSTELPGTIQQKPNKNIQHNKAV
ncbi:unnamed protein product [Arctia plantaginis]|uniref:Uncharacterized protein n=1 Tax=Arctia plantaginis TaxID=874455 RepID=A0A8S1BIP4_ARCPL|nr:unnamed protein product [Arctia plantaginis]